MHLTTVTRWSVCEIFHEAPRYTSGVLSPSPVIYGLMSSTPTQPHPMPCWTVIAVSLKPKWQRRAIETSGTPQRRFMQST